MSKVLKSFNQLMNNIGDTYGCVRLEIREDEDYGKAIIEAPSGCPQEWYYNVESQDWE